MQIFARGHGAANPPNVLVHSGDDSFGVGSNVNTLLYNKEGEVACIKTTFKVNHLFQERATHIQRSSQSAS